MNGEHSAESGPTIGYSRDRSFYSSRPNGQVTKVHRMSDSVPEMAACDTRFILLYLDMLWDVDRLQAEGSTLLCRRCWTRPTPPGEIGGPQ